MLATAPVVAAGFPAGAQERSSNPVAAGHDEPGVRRTTLLRGASLVLTMDPSLGSGPLGQLDGDVDLLLRDGKIAAVGRRLTAPRGTRVMDARGRIVLPGFVDLHNHLWQSSIRGGCSDQDLNGWLGACNRATLPKIDATGIHSFVRLAALDALQAGVTTVVDWVHAIPWETTRRYVDALAGSGMRFVYACTQNPDTLGLITRAKRELIDPLPLASLQVSLHPGMSALPRMRAFRALADELGVTLNSHVLEHRTDRAQEPVRSLVESGILGPDLLMNHAIHLTPEEIDLVAERGVRIAHNPLSNMRLASGICPVPEYAARGVPVGLGHDGGTNDTSDMFAVMKTAVGLQRARHEDPGIAPTLPAVLRMATLGGAEILGMADRIGSLTPGKRADLLVLDPGTLNFAPRFDWIPQIVLNGQPGNVSEVFVDGYLRKSGGRLVGVDTERVVRDAELAADRLRAAG
ncbi:amidohydrolase family protein (plasmid) [Streptomyces sp. BI20]|uniref:amidohydrolase family protein n=1 Tax=Streptomyces sp. BI20 TaxID=3403460 RepID=UPI003C755808